MSRPVFLDSRRDLLQGLIDYAGLYPPASLDLRSAMAEYREARNGPHAWMLGAFVVDAGRLEDLAAALVATMSRSEAPWRVSVILDGEPAASASQAASFEAHMAPAASVAMVEARLPADTADAAEPRERAAAAMPRFKAAAGISPAVFPFLEVPSGLTPSQTRRAVGAIADVSEGRGRRAGAKLGCGGLSADAFPDVDSVAAFMVACRDRSLPFKAGDGLHHPLRHLDADLGVVRHGFMNLLVATALSERGVATGTIAAIVAEQDPSAFSFGASGVGWRGQQAGADVIARMRADRFTSYGSCSFDEPVEELEGLGLLDGIAL